MRIIRKFLIVFLLSAFVAGVFWGLTAADNGCKKIGGYFDTNTLVAVESDTEHYYITIFNEKIILRRF